MSDQQYAHFCDKKIKLAVRDIDKMSERDRYFIPDFDSQHVPDHTDDFGLMDKLALGVLMNYPVLVVGQTGCGKSTSILQLAALLNQPVRRINMHGDVRASDILGCKELIPGEKGTETAFIDGPIPDAMRNDMWLLLEEMDACPPQIAFTLQSVLEPGHRLVLASNAGEVIDPESNFRIFATANTLGRGDLSGMYAGTNILNEAFLDRWFVVEADYLPPDQEQKVLVGRCVGLPQNYAEKMVKVAGEARRGLADAHATATFSTRRLVAWGTVAAALSKGFAQGVDVNRVLAQAYTVAVGNKLGPEDRAYFAGVVQRNMPELKLEVPK